MTIEKLLELRQQGKTLQEIADIYGCTRQYISYYIKHPPKRKNHKNPPTKAELYARVDKLTKENYELQERLDIAKRIEWNALKDKAFEYFYQLTPFSKGFVQFLTLEHIDKVGYWFTFELINDDTRQTYCVRHTDLR